MGGDGPYAFVMSEARWGSRAKAWGGGLALSASLAFLSLDAQAASPANGIGVELRVGTGFAVTRAIPELELSNETALPSREAVSGTLPTAGGFRAFGGFADATLVLRPRMSLPMFGLGAYLPVGDHAPVRSAVDGSIATVQPWRLFAVDVLGPGIGVRTTERRYFFEATARIALLYMGGKAQLAAGREVVDAEVYGVAVGLRAEISACRRLDPENRVCLTFAPRLYEATALSGGNLSLTWVWGN